MDLYGLNEARSQGNSQTKDISLFNEQIRVARDNINNAMDAEKIQAQGNMRSQDNRDLQDKLIYDVHDAISGGQIASSLSKFYTQLKGGKDGASATAKKAQGVFGSATSQGDKISSATTNEVNRTRGVEQIRTGRSGTGIQTAQPLTEEQQSSFLDESARAMGADARPTTQINNRPKINEPVSANENTPAIPEKAPSTTDELSEKILTKTKEAGETVSKVGTGLRVAGDVGGLVSTYELFKNGLDKNKDKSYDVAGDVSQIASSVGTGLDILGAIIPGAGAGFEALGAIAQGVGSIAETIDTHNKDEKATQDAQSDIDNVEKTRQAQLNALPQMKALSAPVSTMATSGLVGTVAQHLSVASSGGTF